MVLLLLSLAVSTYAEAQKDYDEALTLYRSGKVDEASKLLDTFITMYPDDPLMPNAVFYRAELEKDGELAFDYYKRIVVEYADSDLADNALLKIIQFYYSQGLYRKAKDGYEQFMDNYTESDVLDEAQYGLGETLLKMQQIDDAMLAYQKVIEKHPLSEWFSWSQYAIGLAYIIKEDYSSALRELQTVITKYPDAQLMPQTLYKQAECYVKLGESEEAEKIYQEIIDNYPNSNEAMLSQEYTSESTTIGTTTVASEGFYTIQVGSFTDLDNAKELETNLKEKDYNVVIDITEVKGAKRYRVQVGAYPTKEEAIAKAEELKKNEGLNYWVVGK